MLSNELRFNPMAGNPLKTRADVCEALKALYEPLLPFYSPGKARVRLDMAGTHFDRAAADLEGFARPLWGLAPLALGGGDAFVDWAQFRTGLDNGTNPEHPEFWGWPENVNQRLVELAAIGFSLTLIPEKLWDTQSPEAKERITAYLQFAYRREFASNNWLFFRVMIGLGLEAIGAPVEVSLRENYLDRLDALYLGDGWYRDGPWKRADHYIAFAMHFYGLIYAKLGNDAARKARYIERAKSFSADFIRWFADDGAALAFGRSLTYRFACGGFWSALAFTEQPLLPWGEIKGLILRHLRWWSQQPIAHRDGVLSVGYAYPNLHMCEPYNSAGSPYWAFKIFAFMALPETHAFWQAEEVPLRHPDSARVERHPGMILFNPPGDAIALVSGQEEHQKWLRLSAEKYAKFAYSARYAFSVETDFRQFERGSFDNMLAFSFDGCHFHVREGNTRVRIVDGVEPLLYAEWSPVEGITVQTWLLPKAPWHIRIHRIQAVRACQTIEGGFAIGFDEPGIDAINLSWLNPENNAPESTKGRAQFRTSRDFSGICDGALEGSTTLTRSGRVIEALPNSNLMHARSVIPQLCGEIPVGESLLTSAVLVLGDTKAGAAAWSQPPVFPALETLKMRLKEHGREVSVMEYDIEK